MGKIFLILAIAGAVALPFGASFSEEQGKSPATEKHGAMEGHGMMGQGMQDGEMMCPMMGMGGMGMVGGMMGGMGGDPKMMMGQMMQMRGEIMMKMGEVMMKYGKMMQQRDTK